VRGQPLAYEHERARVLQPFCLQAVHAASGGPVQRARPRTRAQRRPCGLPGGRLAVWARMDGHRRHTISGRVPAGRGGAAAAAGWRCRRPGAGRRSPVVCSPLVCLRFAGVGSHNACIKRSITFSVANVATFYLYCRRRWQKHVCKLAPSVALQKNADLPWVDPETPPASEVMQQTFGLSPAAKSRSLGSLNTISDCAVTTADQERSVFMTNSLRELKRTRSPESESCTSQSLLLLSTSCADCVRHLQCCHTRASNQRMKRSLSCKRAGGLLSGPSGELAWHSMQTEPSTGSQQLQTRLYVAR